MTVYQFHTWMTSSKEFDQHGLGVFDRLLAERDGDVLLLTSVTESRAEDESTQTGSAHVTRVATYRGYDATTNEEIFAFSTSKPENTQMTGRFSPEKGEIRLRYEGFAPKIKTADRTYSVSQASASTGLEKRQAQRAPDPELALMA